MTSPDLKKGDLLAGKYRVDRVLGVGGMGRVVAAWHEELKSHVALKLLREDTSKDPEAIARFSREARAASRLRSKHVAHVLDFGKLDDGTQFLVMELLVGQDLEQLIAERGALDVREAVQYALETCEALAEAHRLGIIHRDIKPGNLFLTRDVDGQPLIKVLDFGLAKSVSGDSTARALTGALAAMGSPQYMSPEQMTASRDVDIRTDIWSLGVTLYELTTGQNPFVAATVAEVCVSVLKEEPVPIREIRADLPAKFAAVVMRCLRKEPEERFADVGELAQALVPFGPSTARGSAMRISRIRDRASTIPPSDSQAAEVVRGRLGLPLLGARTGATEVVRADPQGPPGEEGNAGAARASKRGSPGAKVATLLVLAAAVAGGAAITKRFAHARATTSGGLPTNDPPGTATTSGATGGSPEAPAISPFPSSAPSAAPSPARSAISSAASSAAPSAATRHPRPPPARHVTQPARPECDPPFTTDADGTRRYKLECL